LVTSHKTVTSNASFSRPLPLIIQRSLIRAIISRENLFPPAEIGGPPWMTVDLDDRRHRTLPLPPAPRRRRAAPLPLLRELRSGGPRTHSIFAFATAEGRHSRSRAAPPSPAHHCITHLPQQPKQQRSFPITSQFQNFVGATHRRR
jgi:hypothetical protein